MSHLPLSLVNRLKPSLLLSNFGCCVCKGSLFRLLTPFLKKKTWVAPPFIWVHLMRFCNDISSKPFESCFANKKVLVFFFTKIQQTSVESVKKK